MHIVSKLALAGVIFLGLAGCQQTQAPQAPDLSLQDASDSQLHSRIQTTCIATQEKLAAVSYDAIWPSCECYASRTSAASRCGGEECAARDQCVQRDGAREGAELGRCLQAEAA